MNITMSLSDQTCNAYGKTDLVLLSRLLDQIAVGQLDVGLDEQAERTLRDRMSGLSRDLGQLVYGERDDEAVVPAVSQEGPEPDFCVEPWRFGYGQSRKYADWMNGLPKAFRAVISGNARKAVFCRACRGLNRFKDTPSMSFCMDVLAPSVIRQKVLTDPMIEMLINPAFPAYADSNMLSDGRIIIVPTPEVVKALSEMGAFQTGVFGMCKLSNQDLSRVEHMRGVRVNLDDMTAILSNQTSVYDVMYPDVVDIMEDAPDHADDILRDAEARCGQVHDFGMDLFSGIAI